ncbi:hypothetical protein F4823DRAFT_596018 [Ustulina deusta]|nr:hypothetical protein F4823DRAFT_596018 [Ustulina deusta]
MHGPYPHRSIRPQPTSSGQPSTRGPTLAGEPSSTRDVFDTGPDGGGEDEMHPLDVPSSQTPGASTAEDLAGEAKELVDIVLEKFLRAPESLSCGTKGEIFDKRLQTPWLERLVEVEQKSDTDDEDTVIVGSPEPTKSHLACPFYVSQKEKYRNCLTRVDLRGMKDLRRHLETEHRQPSYCPICNDTFVSSADWAEHIRRRSCTSSGKPRPEGITILQISELARRFDSWTSRELQWLLTWEIVFPGAKLPSLAFPPAGVETAVWALRDFWSAEGAQIVSNFLTERQLHYDEPDFVKLGSLVRDLVIDRLVALCRQGGNDD